MIAPTAILRMLPLLRGTQPATAEIAKLPGITRWLALLVLVTILPVLAFSGFMIVRYAQIQRIQYEQQLKATTRATSLAIDALITRQIATLVTLSHSRELKNRDWRAFYELAQDSAADQPNARIASYEPSGQTIFSTLVPYGTVLPASGSPVSIRTVMESKRLYISDLYVGSTSKVSVVGIYLPVIEDGVVVNILSLVLPPSFVSQILQGQMQLPGRIGAVFDRNDKLVARTKNETAFIGHPAVPEFREALRNSDEGNVELWNLEGFLVRSVYVRSPLSGWSTTMAIEKAALDAPLWRSLWMFGGGGGLLLAVALLLALYYGRGFVRPVATLTAMARSLGRGERLARNNMGLREMQIIADQMFQAAGALHNHNGERADLLVRLKNSNESLESANKELESFAYSVSHDLRAPLRAIDGFSHALQEDYGDKLDAEAQRLIQVIRDGVGKMACLIDDILAFSRASRREMAASDIDMAGLVDATLNDLAPAMTGRDIKVNVGPLPQTRGDREMMQRVWMNLLDNGFKFTGHKESALIEVGSYPEAANTVYFVKDNGAGFDMSYVDKLFGVFQRLHGPEDFPGTGAGLAIVKRIVGRHGGRVWAEGKVGEGAAFYFALPRRDAAHV